jgi:hypothetical protein
MPGLGDLLGSIVKQVIGTAEEQLRAQAGLATPGADTAAPAGTAPTDTAPYGMSGKRMPVGETVEALLPSVARTYRRARVNDRFGGARSGGIFAGYEVDGVEVRVLASLFASPAAARERVRSARDNREEVGGFAVTGASVGTEPSWVTVPGGIVWSRGAYCFSASSHGTEGDVPIPATPEEIAALDRFMTAFPF